MLGTLSKAHSLHMERQNSKWPHGLGHELISGVLLVYHKGPYIDRIFSPNVPYISLHYILVQTEYFKGKILSWLIYLT